MSQLKATVEHLTAMDRVLDVLVLDAGKIVLLIISTGGFSVYTPQDGITVVTRKEAVAEASSYWHEHNFLIICKKHDV